MTTLAQLQARLGHTFRSPALLLQALTHPGYTNEHPADGDHYQRLEFLGDAIIQFVVTEALFHLRPAEREGELSRLRVALTNGIFLSGLARELEIPAHLRLCAAEQKTGGSPTAPGDAYEAMVGAIFLDAGLPAAQAFIRRSYGDWEARLASLKIKEANPKGRLQERIQPLHGTGAPTTPRNIPARSSSPTVRSAPVAAPPKKSPKKPPPAPPWLPSKLVLLLVLVLHSSGSPARPPARAVCPPSIHRFPSPSALRLVLFLVIVLFLPP